MLRMHPRSLVALLTIGVVGSVAGWGAYSAFTATTSNTGNNITAGTVIIGQHAGATTLYSSSGQAPGAAITKCVRVTFTGSLASSVKVYESGAISNGTAYNLKIERGSGLSSPDATMNCTGFTASSTAYDAALGSFGSSYAAGIDGKAAGAAWSTNDAIDYRFTISVNDDATANAHTTALASGTHSFVWEARSN